MALTFDTTRETFPLHYVDFIRKLRRADMCASRPVNEEDVEDGTRANWLLPNGDTAHAFYPNPGTIAARCGNLYWVAYAPGNG